MPWRLAGEEVGFVPTMGNFHDGHIQLVSTAQQQADHVIVSIFVNPTQFGEGEDFAAYPRTELQDQLKLEKIKIDVLFMPTVTELYPASAGTTITVADLSCQLCGVTRPGHFSGVATIVGKLFNIIQPDVAYFGDKDFQQLAVIRRMVQDLNIPVRIRKVATVREPDGLAMSSRNGYLTTEQRTTAPLLYQALCHARDAIIAGGMDFAKIEQQQAALLQQAGFAVDYFVVCRCSDLQPATHLDSELVILAAATLGKPRLIDNIQFTRPVSI